MDEVFIAVAGMVTVFSIPIVAILTYHQRKMAEIIHGKRPNQHAEANDAMAAEMHQLRQAIHQQTIALDSLTTEIRKGAQGQSEPLSSRLGQEGSVRT